MFLIELDLNPQPFKFALVSSQRSNFNTLFHFAVTQVVSFIDIGQGLDEFMNINKL